jgi:hypothetical protein
VQQGTPQQGQSPAPETTPSTTTSASTSETPAPTTGSAPQPETPAEPAVPERYELRLPEGTALDQSDLDAIAAEAKTHQWTNEQAQAVLDETHSRLAKQAAAFRAELAADPEVGGARLEHAQLMAQRFLDRFLPATEPKGAELRRDMNKSGHGNKAYLVTLFARAGQAMSEDQSGAGPSGRTFPKEEKRSAADILFGDAKDIRTPG